MVVECKVAKDSEVTYPGWFGLESADIAEEVDRWFPMCTLIQHHLPGAPSKTETIAGPDSRGRSTYLIPRLGAAAGMKFPSLETVLRQNEKLGISPTSNAQPD